MDTTKTIIRNKNYKNLMPNINSSTIKVQKRDGKQEILDITKSISSLKRPVKVYQVLVRHRLK